jgi:hypothetical protein
MKWQRVGVCIVGLMGGTGCPHAFGRGGTVDRAVLADMMELLRENCTQQEIDQYCQDPRSPECQEACGE